MHTPPSRWKTFAALAGLVLTGAASPTASWAMYKCTDANGKVSYQEQPCAANAQSKPLPQASPRTSPARPNQAGNRGSELTVDEFMRNPTPGLENAPACVKAYDAELSRQWGKPRTEADQQKLIAMLAACPEASLGGPPRSAEQRARDEALLQHAKDQVRRELEMTLQATREECALTRRPVGDQRPLPSAQDCAQEIQRLEAALQRQPR